MKLCSGYGQYHSPKNPNDPQPYTNVTLAEIEQLVADPQQAPKENAQWVIFSTLMTRVHSEQRDNGRFYALWADIDTQQDRLTFADTASRTQGAIPEADFIAYTSRSATEDNQKCRLIFPLAEPVDGCTFIILQKILNDTLTAAGIVPDRATERAGQVCYLPNRGEYYRYHFERYSGPLEPTLWSDAIQQEQQRIKDVQKALQQRMENARHKATERMKTGCKSPIDAYNQEYPIELLFDRYGYTQRGNRWLSPNSESGVPGVTCNGQKWLSTHGSDADIGMATSNGTMGDAFDLFTYYEHNNDRNAAMVAAGNMFVVDGLTLNQYNEKKNDSEVAVVTEQPMDLYSFVMNGEAEAMEKQMLDDKFVLGRMAILGQSTALYAKPNAGKTLLTLWLLIKAIERGEITARDVFYINADDSHKGFVYKLKLAEKNGFMMLAPGYKGFKPEKLPEFLNQWTTADEARGKILILDTVKKFTDLMKKDRASKFGECVRQFVMHGGTVVMLAHVNKHRGDDGKVIFSGTSDLVDDADCAYTLDILTEDKATGSRTVMFENIKARGDVAREAVYRYDGAEGTNYTRRLESVEEVGKAEREAAENQRRLDKMLDSNSLAVESIKECIGEGFTQKTALIAEAHQRSGIAKNKISKALADHTGSKVDQYQFWHVNRQDKNAHVYQLNYGVTGGSV